MTLQNRIAEICRTRQHHCDAIGDIDDEIKRLERMIEQQRNPPELRIGIRVTLIAPDDGSGLHNERGTVVMLHQNGNHDRIGVNFDGIDDANVVRFYPQSMLLVE